MKRLATICLRSFLPATVLSLGLCTGASASEAKNGSRQEITSRAS